MLLRCFWHAESVHAERPIPIHGENRNHVQDAKGEKTYAQQQSNFLVDFMKLVPSFKLRNAKTVDCFGHLADGTLRFQSLLLTQDEVSIATLGPEGTSSAAAANVFAQSVAGEVVSSLFPTYEEAAISVVEGRADYLIVANAYAGVNRFYISDQLIAASVFPMKTPPYGVAVAARKRNSSREVSLVSHPAPLHLVEYWFKHSPFSVKMRSANSTGEAADIVASGRADACITTDTARQRAGLVFISPTVSIHMLWTVFVRRDHETAQCLFGVENEKMCICHR